MDSAAAGVASFQRVTEQSVEQQLTAKALIGKNVYDNQGEKLGEVKDVVLDSSRAPQLATAFANRKSAKATDRASSDSMASQPRANPAVTPSGTHAGTSRDRSATAGSSSSMDAERSTDGAKPDWSSLHASVSGGGAAAIISAGGLFSRDDLVRVPLSQLNYDASNDRITVNASRSEFSSLTESDETSRSAAE